MNTGDAGADPPHPAGLASSQAARSRNQVDRRGDSSQVRAGYRNFHPRPSRKASPSTTCQLNRFRRVRGLWKLVARHRESDCSSIGVAQAHGLSCGTNCGSRAVWPRESGAPGAGQRREATPGLTPPRVGASAAVSKDDGSRAPAVPAVGHRQRTVRHLLDRHRRRRRPGGPPVHVERGDLGRVLGPASGHRGRLA